MTLTKEETAALEALEQRRAANIGHQIDNSSLPAGSNMYYYCWACGAQTAVKAEGWYKNPPPHHCVNCQPLVQEGLVGSSITEYDVWLMAHDKDPVPR
jgi:hypothetical protein